jgi:hypothetical protein
MLAVRGFVCLYLYIRDPHILPVTMPTGVYSCFLSQMGLGPWRFKRVLQHGAQATGRKDRAGRKSVQTQQPSIAGLETHVA